MQGQTGADQAHGRVFIPTARREGIDNIGAETKTGHLFRIGVDMSAHAVTGMEQQDSRARRFIRRSIGGDKGVEKRKSVLKCIEQSLYPLKYCNCNSYSY